MTDVIRSRWERDPKRLKLQLRVCPENDFSEDVAPPFQEVVCRMVDVTEVGIMFTQPQGCFLESREGLVQRIH